MKTFIFVTAEEDTKTKKGEEIENLQVLGITKGSDKNEAFVNFMNENSYLIDTDFNEIIAMELVNDKQYYFSLKNDDWR